MSNPFLRSSLSTFTNGPGGSPDNITSLANNTALGLGAVNSVPSSAPWADAYVAPVQFQTGTSSVSGSCSLYLICSEDNSVWDGGISPNSASDQSALIGGARLIQTISTPASGKYIFNEFSVWSKIGFIPSYFTVLLYNQTGTAFASGSSNFYAKYAEDTYT